MIAFALLFSEVGQATVRFLACSCTMWLRYDTIITSLCVILLSRKLEKSSYMGQNNLLFQCHMIFVCRKYFSEVLHKFVKLILSSELS